MTREQFGLYTPGVCALAMPIITSGRALNPKPNFIIFENIWPQLGLKAEFPNAQGEMQLVKCMQSKCKLVYREFLQAANGKEQGMREILIDDIGNQPIPETAYSTMLESNQTMIDYAQAINGFLSLFQFRGCLKGLVMQIDTQALAEYIELEAIIAQEATQPEKLVYLPEDNPAPTPL